jgi:hypothetical protein
MEKGRKGNRRKDIELTPGVVSASMILSPAVVMVSLMSGDT